MNINAISNHLYRTHTRIQPVVHPAESDQPTQPGDEKQSAVSVYSRHPDELTAAEKILLESLKQADQKVKQHEMAHVAAGGRYITSGANFSYKRGPDGINYAVGGEVSIDTSPVPGEPEATLAKMRQVRQAALAPADPSPQDIKVASMATAMATEAMADLMLQQGRDMAEKNETRAFASHRATADSYTRVKNLPEQEMSTFNTAV